MLTLEDFTPGRVFALGPRLVSEDEIVSFGRAFDPQPFHTDPGSPQARMVGGLIASGWHTCGILMRMMCDAYLLETASQGSSGLSRVRWLHPVRPGDVLSGEARVLSARESRSIPGMGIVDFRYGLHTQDGTAVLDVEGLGLMRTRDAPPPATIPDRRAGEDAGAVGDDPEPGAGDTLLSRVVPGMTMRLGEHRFTAGEIIAFASDYDPQPFHLSREGAAKSHFGRLCASGWHTGAVWMRQYITNRVPELQRLTGLETIPDFGPSPGLRNLRWTHPVYEGDTIRFFQSFTGQKPSRRPGWSFLTSRAFAVNQHGVEVMTMDGAGNVPQG